MQLRLFTLAVAAAAAAVLVSPLPAAAVDPGLLLSTAATLIADVKYAPDGNGTHCNLFARDLVDQVLSASVPELGADAPNNLDANQIYTQLVLSASTSGSWIDVTGANDQTTYDDVTRSAKGGAIVVAAWPDPGGSKPHGHLAIIMPIDAVDGYNRTFKVPVVAQAGGPACGTNGVFMTLGLSCGFSALKRPDVRFFKYIGPGA